MKFVYNHLLKYAFYFIIYCLLDSFKLPYVILITIFEYISYRNKYCLCLLLFLLVQPTTLTSFIGNQGQVIDINTNLITIKNEYGQKLNIYFQDINVNYDDLVYFEGELTLTENQPHTYGFDYAKYYHSIGIQEIVYATSLNIIQEGNSLRHLFYEKIQSIESEVIKSYYLKFFYQQKQDQLNTFLVQTGSYYQGLILVIGTLLAYFMRQRPIQLIQLSVLISFILIFGYSYTLFRLIIFLLSNLLVKDKNQRCAIIIFILLIHSPLSIYSISFIFPVAYRLINLFTHHHKGLYGYLLSMVIQSLYFFQINFVTVLFYRYLIRFCGLIFLWMMISFPFVNYFEFSYLIFDQIFNFLSLSSLTLYGKIDYFSLFILIYLLYKKIPVSYVLLLLLAILYFHLNAPFYQIIMVNVGQGDCTLLIAPYHQEVIMIDTGKESEYDAVKTMLMAKGIRKIDSLIISHHDSDHDGNMETIINEFNVTKVVDTHQNVDFHEYTLYSLSESIYESINDNSLVHFLSIDNFNILFTGDISQVVEIDLIRKYDLDIDLLKVAHHGSQTSSNIHFLESITPRFSSISAGDTYGHPHDVTIEALNTVNSTLLISKEIGDVNFYFLKFAIFMKNSLGEFGIII